MIHDNLRRDSKKHIYLPMKKFKVNYKRQGLNARRDEKARLVNKPELTMQSYPHHWYQEWPLGERGPLMN